MPYLHDLVEGECREAILEIVRKRMEGSIERTLNPTHLTPWTALVFSVCLVSSVSETRLLLVSLVPPIRGTKRVLQKRENHTTLYASPSCTKRLRFTNPVTASLALCLAFPDWSGSDASANVSTSVIGINSVFVYLSLSTSSKAF